MSDEPAVNSLPAAKKGYVTFGSLNNFCKVNDSVLQLWARVLQVVDRSRLVLQAAEGYQRTHVVRVMAQNGVESDRISFVDRRPRHQYLESFHCVDIVLDTFPYSGHTTTLDALWMGVPVVTLVGNTVVGRGGLSILSNVGLQYLAAKNTDSFVQNAVEIARDLSGLSALRATLRDRMRHSPLMDAPRFARNMESAYRAMWKSWCVGRTTIYCEISPPAAI